MVKKLLLLVVVLILSSSLIYGANCYTSAEVRNNATIKIVDSKDALIAIKQTEIQNEKTNVSDETMKPLNDVTSVLDEDHVIITVKNNMKTTMKVFAMSRGVRLYNKDEKDNANCFYLTPGKEVSYLVKTCEDKKNCVENNSNLAKDYNKDSDPCIHDIVFHESWDGGTAEINYSVKQ